MSGKLDWQEDEPTKPFELGKWIERPSHNGASAQAPHLYLCFDSSAPFSAPLRISLRDLDEIAIGRATAAATIHQREVRRLVLRRPDQWISNDHGKIVAGGAGLDRG